MVGQENVRSVFSMEEVLKDITGALSLEHREPFWLYVRSAFFDCDLDSLTWQEKLMLSEFLLVLSKHLEFIANCTESVPPPQVSLLCFSERKKT